MITSPSHAGPVPSPAVPHHPVVISALRRLIVIWAGRRASRRALARLDDRLLRDVSISPAEAARESTHPFWR